MFLEKFRMGRFKKAFLEYSWSLHPRCSEKHPIWIHPNEIIVAYLLNELPNDEVFDHFLQLFLISQSKVLGKDHFMETLQREFKKMFNPHYRAEDAFWLLAQETERVKEVVDFIEEFGKVHSRIKGETEQFLEGIIRRATILLARLRGEKEEDLVCLHQQGREIR